MSESVEWLDSVNMLSSLSSLILTHCGLVGMALSHHLNLTSLVYLDLSDNNFNSPLHPSFFNLSSLEYVKITNSLSGPIPNMFQNLNALKDLDLSENSFSSTFPDSLCTLTRLTSLRLSNSSLHGSLPSCIGNLTKLQLLYVSRNSLTAELSESFFDGLKNLDILDISRNQFVALNVPSQWNPPLHIHYLFMDSVFIGVSLPAWLQTLTNLIVLSLRNTSIYGVIPAAWCQTSYPQLESLYLSHNSLIGTIPTFNASVLQYLDFSNNQFTGKIPNELCNLHSMIVLSLANNKLTGRIPSCLGNLQRLRVLDLANNSLSDQIPYELGYLNQLFVLRLNGNKLFGKLPLSLQNLTSLMALDLGKNEFQGFIPSWIGKEFLFLQYLMLQSNNFSGEISVSLCQLQSLRILNLPDNSLVGTIPPCFRNLSKMLSNDSGFEEDFFYSSFGDIFLTMTIKGIELEYSSSLKYAKFISLSGNHLHGEIPDELMDLTELQSLNLSNNELSGKIPKRIGNMKHLESLDLSRNQLSGTIPQSLADIDDLEYLKLSFNNLSGKIPSGGHFDTFDDPSVYEGNTELCGKPTMKKCDEPSNQNEPIFNGDDEFEIEWVYAGIGPGFAVGFLGVFCLLYFKSSWRSALFSFLENV